MTVSALGEWDELAMGEGVSPTCLPKRWAGDRLGAVPNGRTVGPGVPGAGVGTACTAGFLCCVDGNPIEREAVEADNWAG